MRVEKMYPSRWLSGLDLMGKDATVTIEKIHAEKVGQPPKQEEKYVMTFKGKKKQLILNQTNCMSIATQHGPETDNWIGKRITLYSARVDAFGKTHDAVRVREYVRTVSAAPDPVTPAQPNDVPATDAEAEVAYRTAKEKMVQQATDALSVEPHTPVTHDVPDRPVTPAVSLINGSTSDDDDDLWDLDIKMANSPVLEEIDGNPDPLRAALRATADMQGSPQQAEAIQDSNLAPDEVALIESWGVSPVVAQVWAVDVGACKNGFEARNSWKKIIEAHFEGVTITPKEIPFVLIQYYLRQREKLAAQAKVITGEES